MGKLRFDLSVSLDGFVAGPNPSLKDPLGVGGEELHEWVVGTAAFLTHLRYRVVKGTA